MPAPVTILGVLFALQAAGCTADGTKPVGDALPDHTVVVAQHRSVAAESLPGTPITAAPSESSPVSPPESSPVLPPESPSETLSTETNRGDAPVAVEAPARTATPPVPAAPITRTPPATTVPAKVAAPVAPTPAPAAPPQAVAAPSRTAPQGLPPLALATLEQRLKDTKAIGVFTKLALKNQVDDLISQFKAHYDGSRKASLTQLRQSYDQLLLKVHDLLKKDDPPLAVAIMNSRESIWTVLTDPDKFAKL